MPHSTASESMASEGTAEDDGVLPNGPEQGPDPAKDEEKLSTIDGASQSDVSTCRAANMDVKLEDLFDDVEDDEFSGSPITIVNSESRTPESPL